MLDFGFTKSHILDEFGDYCLCFVNLPQLERYLASGVDETGNVG